MSNALIAGRLVAGIALAIVLILDARFVTTFPTRISVVPNLQVDASTYDAIAWELSRTWSIESIPPLQPPGFVAFLAVIFAMFGHSWIAGRLALWGCLVIITVFSGLVARRMYQRELAGWIAALLCATSPALTAYAGTLQYELLAAALLLGILWATVGAANAARPSAVRFFEAAAIGTATGLAILTREVLIVLVPIVGLYFFVRVSSIETRRTALLVGVVYVACAGVPATAWSFMQSARTERVVAISDKGPIVMAFGNNPAANGTFNTPLVGMPDPSGWAFIKAQPAAAAWLWLRKAGYFWGILRDGWNVPRPAGVFVANATAGTMPLQWILPWARGGWLLLVFVIALATWRRDRWTMWWIVPAAVAAIMTVHVVTISSYRFAVPVLPLVMIVGAGVLARGLRFVCQSRPAAVAAVVSVVLALAAQSARWPLVYDLDPTELDGVSGANRLDEMTGAYSRFADASRGRRPVLMLVDEYLASGLLTIHTSVRTDGPNQYPQQPLFRVALTTMEGTTACYHTVNGTQVGERPTDVVLSCELKHQGPSTLLIETLGRANLVFRSVRLAWRADIP